MYFDAMWSGRNAVSNVTLSAQVSTQNHRWFISHFKRDDFEMRIPLSLTETTSRLVSAKGDFSVTLSEGMVGINRPPESLISLSPIGSRNPWRFIVKGSLSTNEAGTWLRGNVGPTSGMQIWTALWLSLVALFLASGLVSMIASVASGRGMANLSLVLESAVLIMVSFAVIEVAAQRARRRWTLIVSELRGLLRIVDVS
jgi:hypothetical protein